MTLVLDTDTVAAGKRADMLQDAFCFASARCRVVHLRDDSEVWGRVRYVPLGPAAEILRHEGSAMWMSRRAEHIESAPAERLSLGIPGTAGGVWMQQGIARPMRVGDLVPVDLTSPYDLRFADGGRDAVQMDIADLSVTVDQVRAASGRLEASPVHGLARDHLRLLCRDAAGIAGSPGGVVRDVWSATAHLVSALIVTAVADGGGPARDALEQTRVQGRAGFPGELPEGSRGDAGGLGCGARMMVRAPHRPGGWAGWGS